MKIYVKGQGSIELSKSDFVASGGEGSVYAKGQTAYKLYTDPSKMIPVGKLTELAGITDSSVIKPEKVVTDKSGKPLGYTMQFVRDTYALVQTFPRTFRDREGLTPKLALDLVARMQALVENVHSAGVLVVDLNDMNFLVSQDFQKLYAIDVDSYQTARYPATALMASIRDWSVQNHDWTELSDWYSFAIVSFNLFTGIHPFKGKHPTIKGFEDRMKQNISVFNPDVRVPNSALPFDVIPQVYQDWYRAVFDQGARLPPPGSFSGPILIIPTVRTLTGTNNLDIMELWGFPEPVVNFFEGFGSIAVVTTNGMFVDQRRVGDSTGHAGIAFTPKMNTAMFVYKEPGRLRLFNSASRTESFLDIRADRVATHDGRVYLQSGTKILEMVFTEIGGKVVPSTRVAHTCLEHATKLYPGVAIQNLLGATWASVYPRTGASYQVHIPELDGLLIMGARFDRGVLIVEAGDGTTWDRWVFRFDDDFKTYDIRKTEDVDLTGLNFVCLDSGICILLTDEEKLELFSVRKGSKGMKVIDDPMVGGDMRLHRHAGQVVFSRGDKVYRIKMK